MFKKLQTIIFMTYSVLLCFVWGCRDNNYSIENAPTGEAKSQEVLVKEFFTQIDNEIRKLVSQHPHLVDWDVTEKDSHGQRSGKKMTKRELIYNHAYLLQIRSSDYKDRYGKNGCHISINAYTKDEFDMLSGRGIKREIFGRSFKVGEFFIIAQVITEKPEAPELERKINDIIRSAINKQKNVKQFPKEHPNLKTN
ncbi:MAG: hypothetical protein ACYSSP_04620 [Planctomycetota bacterium]|jgi:hypothetical protein